MMDKKTQNIIVSILVQFHHIGIGYNTKFDNPIVVHFQTQNIEVRKTFWARLAYELSNRGIIAGISEIPYIEIDQYQSILWIKDMPLICSNGSSTIKLISSIPPPPRFPDMMFLAVGGPSGVGKSTIVQKLKERYNKEIYIPITLTTRKRRSWEKDGIEYHFKKFEDLALYQNDPKYIHFVLTRGNWYWVDAVSLFEGAWRAKNKILLFTITQISEFLDKKIIFPQLQWIWLSAQNEKLYERLKKRGDNGNDIEKSMIHNKLLSCQDRSNLVCTTIDTNNIDSKIVTEIIADFINNSERKIP